ncbi:Fic family protein [Secundilactobacillus similis]|uniref:Fido domain-containing protein n=1 Tax=Secundilactobacillus similis DSM 23365 = JCM 2765 TaxID=1423804 RepID=A0A0R2FBL4_9LACO|nr:Fic family protein [Secundilactobacillus similis]KRN25779.1 hypothetical protein FD14_GL000187 [Secundilactobacillus similis DSM 23365 = JCM 2765]
MVLVEELRNQRDKTMAGNLYYWTQIFFSYNNNHIEGVRLSLDQTQQIFDTGTIFANDKNDPIRVDDIVETQNHFKAFDFVLDTIDEPLTPAYIIQIHKILKTYTSQEKDSRYNVGGFKQVPNDIGMLDAVKTTVPKNVKADLTRLFQNWESQTPNERQQLAQLANFHQSFELIHPFSDGNGRVGRLLLYKELCRAQAVPFIIRDENRTYYIRGLKTFASTPGYLVDTFGYEQDYYETLIQKFLPNFG